VHKEVTTDFCPSTLQSISELAIHLAQEQYKNRPGWKGSQGYAGGGGVRKSGYSAAQRTHMQHRTHSIHVTIPLRKSSHTFTPSPAHPPPYKKAESNRIEKRWVIHTRLMEDGHMVCKLFLCVILY
jgi:hypothetical protein